MTMMLRLVRAMHHRAAVDKLPEDHPMRVCSMELDVACEQRFNTRPPECSAPHYVDAYIRAYAAWHVYTGLDEVV